MKKQIAIFLTMLLCLGILAGTSPDQECRGAGGAEATTFHIASLKGPHHHGYSQIDEGCGGATKHDYQFEIFGPDELVPKLVNGD